MKKLLRISLVLSIVVVGVLATASTALAAKPLGPVGPPPHDIPFLCPIVGNETAAAHNGQGWGTALGGYTFLPGNNQSGAHANPNSWNTEGPTESPGPGNGNRDWSPIWPYHFPPE